MSRKHASLFISLAVLLSLLLGACQPQTAEVTQPVVEVEETAAVPAAEPAETGNLRIWGFYDLTNTEDSRAVQMKQTIESFQATSGVTVDYEQVAWDQMSTKIALAAQAGGDMPDLIMIGYEYVQGLVNAGALLNIQEPVSQAFFYDDLGDFERKMNEVNGERYAVGTFIGGGQWYYDTEMFPAGFPDTEAGWKTECARLSGDDQYVATFFAGRHSAAMAQGLAPLVWSLDSTLFTEEGKPNFATEEMVKAITFWRSLLADKCIPEVSFTGDWSATEAPFVDKTAGGIRGGTWSYIYVSGLQDRFESGAVKVGNPPALEGGKQGYVFMNAENWAITADTQNAENAMKFISFFFTPAVLAPWAQSNFGVPSTGEALANPIFDSQFYKDTLDNLSRNGHPSETSLYYNESMDALSAKVQELVLNPEMDILAEMQKLQDELLAQYFQ